MQIALDPGFDMSGFIDCLLTAFTCSEFEMLEQIQLVMMTVMTLIISNNNNNNNFCHRQVLRHTLR